MHARVAVILGVYISSNGKRMHVGNFQREWLGPDVIYIWERGASPPLPGADLRPLGDGDWAGDALPERHEEGAEVWLRLRVDARRGGDPAPAATRGIRHADR